ncbi:hypothetical protein GCM10027298_29070 [Epidermidibacterium keratini]
MLSRLPSLTIDPARRPQSTSAVEAKAARSAAKITKAAADKAAADKAAADKAAADAARAADAAGSTSTPAASRGRSMRSRASFTLAAAAAAVLAAPVLMPSTPAYADPSADQWAALRMCESSNRYSINTGNGYYGAYQFDLPTWQSVGGTGYPHQASAAEQDARALMLYRKRGWQPWECASKLGFVNDGDAKSGYTGDISIGGSGGGGGGSSTSGMPAFPGQISYGQYSSQLKAWQAQMASRGANIPATGYFGDITKALALEVQRQNGFSQVGWIGPQTWVAAWGGSYSASGGGSSSGSSGGSSSSSQPPFPGQISYGQYSPLLKLWQQQMANRGANIPATGYFGDITKGLALKLQRQNGFEIVGWIGPKTWAAAWSGNFSG